MWRAVKILHVCLRFDHLKSTQFVCDHTSQVLSSGNGLVVLVHTIYYYTIYNSTALIAGTPDGIMEKSMAASLGGIADITPEEKTSDKIKAICNKGFKSMCAVSMHLKKTAA